MVDKILIWIDELLWYFGIAKYIKDNHDCEISAIYDVNKNLKDIFKNQNFVKIEKQWFFWDYIKKLDKPDLDYLMRMEKKYNLNLWLMMYNDRLFYKFNDLYKFTDNEMLSICEKECKLYETILDETKPDFLVINNTYSRRTHLLKLMCDSRNIQVLMLHRNRIGYRSTISKTYDKNTDLPNFQYEDGKSTTDFDLENFRKKYVDFKHKEKNVVSANAPILNKIKTILGWIREPITEEYKDAYTHFGISKFNVIKIQLSSHLKNYFRKKFIDKNLLREIPDDQKFLYFPLHRQPERSISIDSPFFNNQLDIITNLAKSLPVDYLVYVKEHPDQYIYNWRPNSFYNQIMNLPNVKLFHPSVATSKLFKKCSIVATITGTAGLESAFYGKPSLVFTDTIYSHLPHVSRIKNIEELPYAIEESLNKKINSESVKQLLNYFQEISFDVNIVDLQNELNNKFRQGSVSTRRNISLDELEKFFIERKDVYNEIALQHIEKINQHKNIKFKNKN